MNSRSTARSRTRGSKTEVLLLDDERPFAQIIKEYLETFDCRVTIAKDGVEGIICVLKQRFDIIISDLVMPGIGGDRFFRAVQEISPELATRFIFITGHQHNSGVSRFLDEGNAITMFKPLSLHMLPDLISFALNTARPPKCWYSPLRQ